MGLEQERQISAPEEVLDEETIKKLARKKWAEIKKRLSHPLLCFILALSCVPAAGLAIDNNSSFPMEADRPTPTKTFLTPSYTPPPSETPTPTNTPLPTEPPRPIPTRPFCDPIASVEIITIKKDIDTYTFYPRVRPSWGQCWPLRAKWNDGREEWRPQRDFEPGVHQVEVTVYNADYSLSALTEITVPHRVHLPMVVRDR